MILSPKTTFNRDEVDARKLASLSNDESFHHALDYALLSYVKKVAKYEGADFNASAVAFHQIKGASEYIDELLKLHEMPTVSDRKPIGNLNLKA